MVSAICSPMHASTALLVHWLLAGDASLKLCSERESCGWTDQVPEKCRGTTTQAWPVLHGGLISTLVSSPEAAISHSGNVEQGSFCGRVGTSRLTTLVSYS